MSCAVYFTPIDTVATNIKMDQDPDQLMDPNLDRMVVPYRDSMNRIMGKVIGIASGKFEKRSPSSSFFNFMSDLTTESIRIYSGKQVDGGIYNAGSIRIPELMKGGITKGKVFEIMPFDNLSVVLHISGDTLMLICDEIAQKGGWPIEGMTMKIQDGKVQEVKVQGEAIQKDRIYHIATSDYLANGGDKLDFLRDAQRSTYPYLVRDAILDAIERRTKSGKTVDPVIDFRITNQK